MNRPFYATLALLAVAAALGLVHDADARVGGGETFSTGRGGGQGGGGGEGEILFLLVRLAIFYPQIGVPLLIVGLGFFLWSKRTERRDRGAHIEGHRRHHAPHTRTHPGRGLPPGWDALLDHDPALSEPVLLDQLQLVHRRAWEAVNLHRERSDGPDLPEALANLIPFVSADAWGGLARTRAQRITEVVQASVRVHRVKLRAGRAEITVRFTGARLEADAKGRTRRVYVEEQWRFARDAGATSPPPEDAQRLGCPACGAAGQVDAMGRCRSCDTPIAHGEHNWQALGVEIRERRPLGAPHLSRGGGDDASVAAATVVSPDLAAQMRSFTGRHPDFDAALWEQRVHHSFRALQAAWSASRWQDARPYTTDAAWNTLRFWLLQYADAGLRNRVEDVKILKMQVVAMRTDAWYESVTVRLWAEARDWVEDAQGTVVGGDARQAHAFSEYWTFLRGIGAHPKHTDPARCPSCGAPLDRVNAAGVCGYCDSVITTGRFDWVLSRIEAAEVYGR